MYQMPESRDRLQTEPSDAASRVVVDGEGNEWLVREVDTPQPWAHAKRCLIFSSSAVVRRLWIYPEDWSRLASRDLLALVQEQPRSR
ncbi:MAG: hypothetical protein ABI601_00990 [bacterium]